MTVEPRQVRAAMAFLGWPSKVLGWRAGGMSSGCARDGLNGRRPHVFPRLVAAVEAEGIEFVEGGFRHVPQPEKRP